MFDRDSFVPVSETRFHDLRHVVSTGSTNSDLAQLAEKLAANGRPIVPTVLVADRQTAGKGRRGRIWESGRPTGLWVSVLVPAPRPITDLGWLLASAGIALVDALRPLGVAAGLKWPNDIVIPTEGGDRKLAGMLSESTSHRGQVHGIVIGLGCNIDAIPPDLPEAIAVADVANEHVDRFDLLAAWLVGLDRWLSRLETLGAASVRDGYRDRSATLGRRVRIEAPDGSWEGRAIDVDHGGHLLVEVQGDVRTVVAGDVVHLRAIS